MSINEAQSDCLYKVFMYRSLHSVLIAVACLMAQLCGAESEDIDEVLVNGMRLSELRAAIVAAEDRFYARYNELNKVDDFDIDCATDAHTGTRIGRRRCFTKLQRDAMAQNGIEVLEMFQQQRMPVDPMSGPPGSAGMTAVGRPPNTDPQVVWLAHYDEYRNNMLKLLRGNADLRRMAREAARAQQRYDEQYKRRLKGRLVLIE